MTLESRLRRFLDNGHGRVPDELMPLLNALVMMPEPLRGIVWLNNNRFIGGYLNGLATGRIPLTHQGLHELESWRTAAHLRDLLMQYGILPRVDRHILLFERWYLHQVRAIARPEHAMLLRQFTTWYQLPRLHARAGRRPVGPRGRNHAAAQFLAGSRFLAWLGDRNLGQTTQANIDSWYATANTNDRNKIQGFLSWAVASKHMPRVKPPRRRDGQAEPISPQRRLRLLRDVLVDETTPLRVRVAACLVLLYAQPLSRVVQLTVADVIVAGAEVQLRLGDPPSPVPQPFATLLQQQLTARASMNSAANPDARWLFPGERADQPLTPGAFRYGFAKLGIPTIQARAAAFRQLVLDAPPPVVAQAIGYSAEHAHRQCADAGAVWARYAAPEPSKQETVNNNVD